MFVVDTINNTSNRVIITHSNACIKHCWLDPSSWLNVILSNCCINNSMPNAVNWFVCNSFIHSFIDSKWDAIENSVAFLAKCHLRFGGSTIKSFTVDQSPFAPSHCDVDLRLLKSVCLFALYLVVRFSHLIHWKLHPNICAAQTNLQKRQNKLRTFATCSNI